MNPKLLRLSLSFNTHLQPHTTFLTYKHSNSTATACFDHNYPFYLSHTIMPAATVEKQAHQHANKILRMEITAATVEKCCLDWTQKPTPKIKQGFYNKPQPKYMLLGLSNLLQYSCVFLIAR